MTPSASTDTSIPADRQVLHIGSHQDERGGRAVQRELTLEEFYTCDPQRAAAAQVPYGSLWREFAPVPTYRLAWVPTTGELYAMELSEPDERRRRGRSAARRLVLSVTGSVTRVSLVAVAVRSAAGQHASSHIMLSCRRTLRVAPDAPGASKFPPLE
jgi:hypothetical protein